MSDSERKDSPEPTGIVELIKLGFTPDQATHLLKLKARTTRKRKAESSPEISMEQKRGNFVKWLYEHNKIKG